MFILKKLCGSLCMSMPLLAALFIIAVGMLWFCRRQVLAKVILTFTIMLFILAGYGVFSRPLLEYLESRYAPVDIQSAAQAGITWVVVFGGGHVSDPSLPVTSQLSFESQARLIEGVRIMRALPNSHLLVSGGAVWGTTTLAELLARLAQEIGVPQAKIVLERESRDTKDEARMIKPIIGDEPFILVTSAYHLPRSMALCSAQGLKPIPAPAGKLYHPIKIISPSLLFPSAKNLSETDMALHEVLGLASAKIMGQL